MNPWEIVSWLGAGAVSMVIVLLVAAVVVGVVRSVRKSAFERVIEKGWKR